MPPARAAGARVACYNRRVLSIGQVLRDAAALYGLLWRRGVAVGAAVFAVIAVANVLAGRASGRGPELAVLVLFFVGPVFVQGVLVEAVRNAHEGRPQESWRRLYERTGSIFPALLVGTLLYGVGVGVGFVLLVLPGLLLAARWALFAPLIVLEAQPLGEALRRSNELVRGRTLPVLGTLVAMYVGVALPGLLLEAAIGGGTVAAGVVGFVWQALAAPFEAYVLTSIYYHLTDRDRPVVHPDALAGRR